MGGVTDGGRLVDYMDSVVLAGLEYAQAGDPAFEDCARMERLMI